MVEDKKVKKITVSLVLSWIFGVLFGLSGLSFLFTGSFVAGISLILASLILFPPINKLTKEKLNFELSRGLKITLVIILFVIYCFNLPDYSNEQHSDIKPLEVNHQQETSKEGESCANECTQSMCFGFDYEECAEWGDGCMHKNIQKKVKGKCGVVCLTSVDCVSDEECNNYKCVSTLYQINQNINVDYLTYKVTKAETFTEMGVSMIKKETTGKFIKVYLEILNNAKETQQIFTPRFKVIDNQGRVYDRLSDDMMYITDYLEFGKQLQPGLKTSGAIVFEMPKDSTNLKLEISGDWLSVTKVVVDLSNVRNIGRDTTLQAKQDEMWDDAMEESQSQMEEIMNKCNSPFSCSSSCPEYMDVGQKDCPSGKLCCMS
jgi:hypothetical protein